MVLKQCSLSPVLHTNFLQFCWLQLPFTLPVAIWDGHWTIPLFGPMAGSTSWYFAALNQGVGPGWQSDHGHQAPDDILSSANQRRNRMLSIDPTRTNRKWNQHQQIGACFLRMNIRFRSIYVPDDQNYQVNPPCGRNLGPLVKLLVLRSGHLLRLFPTLTSFAFVAFAALWGQVTFGRWPRS